MPTLVQVTLISEAPEPALLRKVPALTSEGVPLTVARTLLSA
jgi:hypothetical protein